MSEAAFLDWGWRVPFLASIVLIAVGLYIRVGVLETPAFQQSSIPYAAYSRLTSIAEDNDSVPAALTMVRNLTLGHEALGRTLRAAFKTAEAGGDQATMDLLIGRMEASDKAAWMLRSHLESTASDALSYAPSRL